MRRGYSAGNQTEERMTTSPRVAHSNSSLGDSAVDGLLAGAGAGLLMGLYVAAAGLLAGQGLGSILAQFDPSPTPSALTGVLAHLAMAGVYGIVFAVAWRWVRRLWRRGPAWLAGALYGGGLWALAQLLLALPAGQAEGWLAGVSPVNLAVAHLVYGLTLGWLLGRRGAVD